MLQSAPQNNESDVEVTTWFDRKSLLPGQKWEDVIDDEIPRSKTFLTCLSKAAMDKKGYFHVEQHLASEAALRIPPEDLFILPVVLGDCEVPRKLKQYHTVNLVEPGAIEMLLLMGLIERIANSSDAHRLGILLSLRAHDFLSYAEQAALDRAINNVKAGHRTERLQATVKADEMDRIAPMGIPGNLEATQLLQLNKYFRYISRKNTEPYKMAEEKIRNLLAGRD